LITRNCWRENVIKTSHYVEQLQSHGRPECNIGFFLSVAWLF
jgi:hypothetical protein